MQRRAYYLPPPSGEPHVGMHIRSTTCGIPAEMVGPTLPTWMTTNTLPILFFLFPHLEHHILSLPMIQATNVCAVDGMMKLCIGLYLHISPRGLAGGQEPCAESRTLRRCARFCLPFPEAGSGSREFPRGEDGGGAGCIEYVES